MIVLVTDPRYPIAWTCEAIARVGHALRPGELAVQLRDKSGRPKEESIRRIREAARAAGALFVLNGSPEEACDALADGAHLPENAADLARARALLGGRAFVSIAAHDDDAVLRARDGGANAVLVSPIFETPGKGPARGVDALRRARALGADRLRVLALG